MEGGGALLHWTAKKAKFLVKLYGQAQPSGDRHARSVEKRGSGGRGRSPIKEERRASREKKAGGTY